MVDKLLLNPWRVFAILVLLGVGAKGGWDFYWWNQWLKKVSFENQQVIQFLGEPVVKLKDGKSLTRADMLNLFIQQAVKPQTAENK